MFTTTTGLGLLTILFSLQAVHLTYFKLVRIFFRLLKKFQRFSRFRTSKEKMKHLIGFDAREVMKTYLIESKNLAGSENLQYLQISEIYHREKNHYKLIFKIKILHKMSAYLNIYLPKLAKRSVCKSDSHFTG